MDLLITSLMTNLGVHILPLAFPCTLAMIRKVATMIGPGQPRSLIRMAGLVYELSFEQQAASFELKKDLT